MRKILFGCMMLLLNSASLKSQLSQEWIRSFNGSANGTDESLSHTIDNSGNIYAAGKVTGSASGTDIYVVKYGSSGNILWEKFHNGTGNGNDVAHAISLDDSGNVYIAGESKGLNTESDYILIKYDTQGIEQWNRTFNGGSNSIDVAVAIAVDNAGNPIITGRCHEPTSAFDIVTVKYDGDGSILWVRSFNGPANGNDFADDLGVDAFGNVFVSGSTLSPGTINDFVVIAYNSDGNELWANTYNGPVNGNELATSLTIDYMGNAIVTGSSVGAGTSLDFATIKYSPAGDEIWIRRYTGPANSSPDEPRDIACDSDGNIYVTGSSVGSSTSYDYLTVKYSGSGDEMWARRYNGTASLSFDEARSVCVDGNGNVYVAGLSEGNGTMDDIAIIKYNSAGDQLWVNRYNSQANNNDIANNISADPSGNLIVSGLITGSTSGRDFAVMKFSQLTSATELSNGSPEDFALFQNYPNPFNPATSIRFAVPRTSLVSLTVFDVSGKEVTTLVNGTLTAGVHVVVFESTGLSGGIYFYRLQSGLFSETKKMMFIK